MPCPRVRAGGALSLCRRPQLHPAGRAARKISRHARHARLRARRTGAGQRARRATTRPCSMRSRAVPIGCAASRSPTQSVPAAELRRWHALGVRGLRFNHFFRDGQLHYRGGVPLEAARVLAPVMRELGWHLQLWIDVKDLPETIPILQALDLPVVIDHMGRTDARAGTGDRRIPEPAAPARRRRLLGQAVGRAPHQPQARPTIPTRSRCTPPWSPRIPSGWSGAATGRTRAWRRRCRRWAISSTCSSNGRRTPRSGSASWSPTRRGFTGSRTSDANATRQSHVASSAAATSRRACAQNPIMSNLVSVTCGPMRAALARCQAV